MIIGSVNSGINHDKFTQMSQGAEATFLGDGDGDIDEPSELAFLAAWCVIAQVLCPARFDPYHQAQHPKKHPCQSPRQ